MARTDDKISCARAQVLLEAYLDAELAPGRVSKLESHLARCAGCAAELQHARRVCDGLRALPEQQIDASVLASVLERARRKGRATSAAPRRGAAGSWSDRLRAWTTWGWRPAIATAGVAGLAIALMVMSRPRVQEFDDEDLARAELQVQWVLARLSDISRATGITVRDEVLEARVVAPASKAVEAVRDANP